MVVDFGDVASTLSPSFSVLSSCDATSVFSSASSSLTSSSTGGSSISDQCLVTFFVNRALPPKVPILLSLGFTAGRRNSMSHLSVCEPKMKHTRPRVKMRRPAGTNAAGPTPIEFATNSTDPIVKHVEPQKLAPADEVSVLRLQPGHVPCINSVEPARKKNEPSL